MELVDAAEVCSSVNKRAQLDDLREALNIAFDLMSDAQWAKYQALRRERVLKRLSGSVLPLPPLRHPERFAESFPPFPSSHEAGS
jgi:hypothetical protein